MRRSLSAAILLASFLLSGCATLNADALGDLLGQAPLDEATVAAGLKQALSIGSGRAVDTVSVVDGFLADELLRIAIPQQLSGVTSTLRDLGLNAPVDDLEIGMNRAASLAAGEARTVLTTAVSQLTIADAFAILNGGDTAATDLFRARTGDELRTRFRPLVNDAMAQVGVARIYNTMVDAYDALPLTKKPEMVDLEDYVVEGTVNGVFTELGREEALIRHDPVARTTDLLKRVFGRDDAAN
ncbi:DUF4197 domain-containing protein [bacterium]|nr:DUF4197 domain-containing protein [bacterium]HPF35751.1 DUF4197 domain-containing protein [Candidatus Krumholzibacteria bacterium]HRX51381.1 DUF4197 domain-containing protein [Candidatus Krumholzibacteria bacterium]